ncbi:MAG: hypothetical protein HY591_05305 [Candidatus Omnitrophica bacterium]|nr:hypothetical protein [Candidatus Omnitrophota bacterium]
MFTQTLGDAQGNAHGVVCGDGCVDGLQHDVEQFTVSVCVPLPPQEAVHVPGNTVQVPLNGLSHGVVWGDGCVDGSQQDVEQVTTSVCVPLPPQEAEHVPGATFHVPVKGFEQGLSVSGFGSGQHFFGGQVTVRVSTPSPPQEAVHVFQPPMSQGSSKTVHTQGGPVFSHGLPQLSVPVVVSSQEGFGASQNIFMQVVQLLCPDGCVLFSQQYDLLSSPQLNFARSSHSKSPGLHGKGAGPDFTNSP